MKLFRTGPDRASPPATGRRPAGGELLAVLLALLAGAGQPGCGTHAGERRQESAAAPPAPAVVYEGAWFTITAPAGFAPRPSLPSETAAGYDSVFFDAPDGRATFYVCSPQWGRQPIDVALDPAAETLLAERLTERGAETVERREIAALDGSYERLVEIVFSPATGAQWAFGFRWSDAAAREEHREAYERFKASLEQYAD